jgi:hypothetical protein
VDANVLQERIADVEKIQGKAPKGYSDFRKMLEHKGLDNHMSNFIDGVKNGAELNCPVEIAAGVARTCHLGNIAYKTGRRLYWDSGKSKFINDKDADSYLMPGYRKPWEVPVV